MSDVDHWAVSTIGRVFAVVGGGTPSTEQQEYWGGITPWITSADIDGDFGLHSRRSVTEDGLANSPTTAVPINSVIVATRVGLGKVGLVGGTATCFSQDCHALLPIEGINPRFAAYQLKWLAGRFRERSRGTTISGITKAQLVETPFSVPPSREQTRIADTLDELLSDLEAGVVVMEQGQRKLGLYRAAVLKAAVEGALTSEWRQQHPNVESATGLLRRILAERRDRWEEQQLRDFGETGQTLPKNWRERYKEPLPPDDSNPKVLPQGWCWAALDQIGALDRGRSKHRPRDAPFLYGGPYPFIQTGDVRKARQYVREHSQTYSEAGLKQSRIWPAETLCITIAANIAETALLSYPACFPDSVVGVVFESSTVCARYIEMFIRSAKASISAYAPATAQKNINNETLRTLAVPLPPHHEQHAIVDWAEDLLSVADHTDDEIQAQLKNVRGLQNSILRHAFTGQLVPQDPNDEPASELLKRIAAERNARAKKAATAKRAFRAPKKTPEVP